MTAVTVRATATAPRSRGPRGLVWVMLQVHRSALLFWLMLVAVAAGALLWASGPGADAAEEVFRQLDCGTHGLCDTSSAAYRRYELAVTLGRGLLAIAPPLIAAWAGGALIGRELENGTARLAWTQSVTPVRWLAAKLAVPAAIIVTGTVLLTLLHRLMWWQDGLVRQGTHARDWYDSTTFLANGTLGTAYALLGLAVGALAGLVVRRALAGLAVGAVGLLSLAHLGSELRPYLWPVETVVSEDETTHPGAVVDTGLLSSTGDRLPIPDCWGSPGCLPGHDITGFYTDYHPSSHFWPLQLVETGIVLALAGAAVGAAFWLLRRRTV